MASFLIGCFTMGYWGLWCWRFGHIRETHGDKGVLFVGHALFILSTRKPRQNVQYGLLCAVLTYGNLLLNNFAPFIAAFTLMVFVLLCAIGSILKYGDNAYYEWLISLDTKNTGV